MDTGMSIRKMYKDRPVPLLSGLQEDLKECLEKYRMRSYPRPLFITEKGSIRNGYIRSFTKKLGVEQNKWEHWDLNPDLRVSSRFIVPVNHHLFS